MDEPVRSAVRWAATHGAMRVAIRARARTGNPDAQVMTDPALRADPYAHYERLRTAAPFADGALGRVSVHHDVCTDVLRSEDFGQIVPTGPTGCRQRSGWRCGWPATGRG